MGHLPGNPHYESSHGTLVRIKGKTMTFPESENVLRGAQVTATLALAYEQRTANLIQLFALGKEPVAEFLDATALESSAWDSLAQQIAARTGLNEGANK